MASAGRSRSSRRSSGTISPEQRLIGQSGSEAQRDGADLALLHALIGHYARQLWGLQRSRLALTYRAGALRRDGLPEQWCAPLLVATVDLAAAERAIDCQLRRLARQHFLRAWVERTPGIALGGFARLIGVTGPLERFGTASKLWAFVGLDVQDGMAPRRRRGQQQRWSAQGRVVCHQLGVAIVRVNRGPYRAAYDRKKAEYLARPPRGPSACPFGQTHRTWQGDIRSCTRKHPHFAAMRYAVKLLLRDLWLAWRRECPAEPLFGGGVPSDTAL